MRLSPAVLGRVRSPLVAPTLNCREAHRPWAFRGLPRGAARGVARVLVQVPQEPRPLTSNTRTTTALLNGLRDPCDASAWRELTDRCCPIMRAVAVRLGVADADLDDVIQTTLVTFVESWRRGQYDRARGRLSNFLVTILRSRILDLQRRQWRRAGARGGSALVDLPSVVEVERLWMDERQKRLLVVALEELRRGGVEEQSLQAFELYALRGSDADEVAAMLSVSREHVYDTKYRLSRRLRPIMARLGELYEDA